MSTKIRELFENGSALGEMADVRQGLATTDNTLFLRQWHEINITGIGFEIETPTEACLTGKKWFPFNKGGEFRKWYGNQDYIVNWKNDGAEIKENILFKYPYLKTPDFVAKNQSFYFKPSDVC